MKYKKGKILAVLLSGALLGAQMPGAALTGEAAGYTGGMAYTAEYGYEAEGGTETVSQTVSEGLKAVPKTMAAEPEAETGTEEESSGEKTTGAAKPKTTESANGPETGTTVPEKTTTIPEETTTVPEKTTATPEETITAPEKTTTAPEETTTGPEETVTGPETGPTGPTETQTADPEESETDPEESGTETEESETETESPEDGTDAETEASQEKTAAKGKGAAEKTPDSDAEAETDKAVSEVQAMIDALPSVEEVERMSPEEQKEVYDAAQDAADAYFDGLTEDQQEQVDTARLEELMNYFNGQVSTMASSEDGWTLSDDGELTITSNAGCTSDKWYSNPYITKVIIENGVTSIGTQAFSNCTNLTSVTIGENATIGSIGEYAFYQCSSLNSVTIEKGATIGSIGKYAFSNCTNLTSVKIGENATIDSIGIQAFSRCSSLNSVTIEKGATIGNIGSSAFIRCTNLTSITIEEGATIGSIGEYAFSICTNLTSVKIGENATIESIGENAFDGCSSLTSITIPDSVTSIGEAAFYNCSGLTSITIPESVTSIGGYAFYSCSSLTSVTIPESVTSIGDLAFCGCNELTSITISDGVTSIGEAAFYNCSGLTSITIPDSVTSIGKNAFRGCSNLTKVTLPAAAPTTVSTNSFPGSWDQINFIIPETSIGTGNGQYNLNASPWNQIKILNGSSLIRSVAVTLTEPVGGSVLPTSASCDPTVVANSSVSWTLDGSPVEDDAKAEYGKSYTAVITLTAVTPTDTSAVPHGYRFVDGITTTLNGTAVTATVSDSGKTLTISKNYQMKQSQNSPDISIDYQSETLNTTAGMEYSVDNGGSWKNCDKDMKATALGWDGTEKAVQIRMKETGDAYASDPASVTIPARPAVTVSQVTGSTTAGSLTVQADVPQGAEVQYQLVADGGSIDSEKWQESGKFTNLSADTAYTAYAKCKATASSFASDISSGQEVRTSAASYTVSIPSTTLTAGDSMSAVTISVSGSGQSPFDLGYNGQVQVKVQSGGAVSRDGKLTLTRQGASGTITSAMLVDGKTFTDITKPVAEFTMDNYQEQGAGKTVSFAQPTGTQAAIPAGTYSGTVVFVVSYSEGEVETE